MVFRLLRGRRDFLRFSIPIVSACLFVAGVGATPNHALTAKTKPKRIEFNRDIRPILDKCSSCHGHDPKALRAGLRLDRRDGATKVLADGRRAIVPGHPEQSELIKRINSTDRFSLMPPPSSNRVLSSEEKATLAEWIKEGAEYKPHWAFVRPVRWPLPTVTQKAWPRGPIDYFVLAKLEENGLKPSSDADRRTLIRRVSLDLIGLPPTPSEVDAFLADKSPNAYEKVVDRLLASPRYGERMAMDWMDCARYADSNGYQSDWERYQYRWRDWVIDAFNQNMPYDEFTIEQLAGDLLPHPTLNQIIATGFNRNHRINTEGGVIPEEWRIEGVIDRVETTSAVWLGLTAGCARCHDHKYDPVSQKEFYSLCSYFNNVPESGTGEERPVNHPPLIKAPYPDQASTMAKLVARLCKLDAEIKPKLAAAQALAQNWKPGASPEPDSLKKGIVARYRFTPASGVGTVAAARAALKQSPASLGAGSILADQPVRQLLSGLKSGVPRRAEARAPEWNQNGQVAFEIGRSTGAAVVGDKGFLDLGNVGDFDWKQPFSYAVWIARDSDSGSPVSRMDSSSNYRGWDMFLQGGRPAIHIIHNWPQNALKVVSKTMLPKGEWSHVAITYDGSAKPAGIHIYVDGKSTDQDIEANSLTDTIRTTVHARVGRRVDSDYFSGKVDDLALFDRVLSSDEVKALSSVGLAQSLTRIPVDKRTPKERDEITRLWALANDPAFKKLDAERDATAKARDELDSQITTVMVMSEMPKPRDCFVLVRGQYDHHGQVVTAGVPAAFPALPKGVPNNRLGLAKWIVDPANPLTSRVTVNRMWERLYGTGLVATSEDFGTRSEFPSHPELLDWLATELIRQKWDLKAMWKELVMSRTYRQESRVTPSLEALDPNNRLLARGPRMRLPAEVLRDQALMVSGLLREKIGGPSVRPYQPNGIWDDVSVYGNLHNYKPDADPNLHRRSLYTIWKRTAAPPDMTLFDAPARETCRVRRARTDTPLQALVMLNDETYVEASRALAQKMLKEGGRGSADRVAFAFRAVLGRNPTKAESQILTAGLSRREKRFRERPEAAKKLISVGELKNDPKLNPVELAAYTITASTILNLDETLTKE